jgi:hypothetical protein
MNEANLVERDRASLCLLQQEDDPIGFEPDVNELGFHGDASDRSGSQATISKSGVIR